MSAEAGVPPLLRRPIHICFFSDVVTVARAHQNNIFWNARSNAVGGGVAHLATREGGTAANPAGLTSNYNVLYFSGTDGATGVFNAAVVANIAAWRTATGQDNNSFHADPMLVDPDGTASFLLPRRFSIFTSIRELRV